MLGLTTLQDAAGEAEAVDWRAFKSTYQRRSIRDRVPVMMGASLYAITTVEAVKVAVQP